jgi:outer membrane receptor protein involved in Fe transport
MSYKILMILLCLIVGKVQARQVITGKLADKETTKPVEAANVELLQLPDSLVVESMRTNTEGTFTFYKGDTAKSFCLRISHVSYKTLVMPVSKKSGMINSMGVIPLDLAIFSVKEVVINGSKIRVTELPDRTIYGIPGDVKKTSTDGLDVLRKVPSVQVDYLNENITVDGKTNIKIEVDGVTRDKEYLKKLHPSQIDKLEVVTSPSGKYDAEVDAVINVVTDRAMRYGLKGTVGAQVLPKSTERYMGRYNVSLDYGLEKISYYGAVNGGVQQFQFINTLDRSSGVNSLNRYGTQSMKGDNENLNVGLIYNPDELNNLNFNVSLNRNKALNDGDLFNYNFENNSPTNIYRTTTNGDNTSNGLNTSLFYKRKLDKKTQHGYEIEATYYNSLSNINKTKVQNINYTLDTVPILPASPFFTEESKTNRQTIGTQANYTLPFDSVYTFGIGIGGNFNQYKVDNKKYMGELNFPVPDSSNLDYKDLRGSFFSELSRTFKKGSIKIGSRVEAAHVTINSTNTNDYFSPLPYANGQYKINDRTSLRLAYSRRVIRPSSDQLNPFKSEVDSQTVSRGNTHLRPAYRDNFQLTYSLKYGKSKFSGSISPQIFYEYKTRLIQRITEPTSSTEFQNYPVNISNGYETGIGIALNAQIAMVIFNSNFRYSYNHVDRYLTQIDQVDQQSWSWNSYAVSPLPLNLRLFTVLYMTGPTVNGQEVQKRSPFYLVGIVKQFKNNSSLNLMVFNPFAEKFFDNTTTINNQNLYQRSETYMHLKNAIMLSYSYNFKIGKAINLQKHNIEENNEENGNKLPF